MRRLTKVGFVVLAVPLMVLAYFAPNIRGYYRFKEICDVEGGLRVFEKIKKNQGWLVPDGPIGLAHIAFQRGKNRFGEARDYRYVGGRLGDDRSFSESPIDPALVPMYEYRFINVALPGELRTRKFGYEVWDISSGRLMARWYQISYSRFEQERTLLAAPSGIVCHSAKGWHERGTVNELFVD